MAKKNNLVVIGVVLFGLLAAGLTAFMLMGKPGGNPAPAEAAPTLVSQWVAREPIAPRTAIRRDMLEEVKVDVAKAAPNAITDWTTVQGKLASQTLEAGTPITTDVVVDAIKRVAPANIPVPDGFRGVAVWVDPDQTAAGLVDAGDRVDVLVNHKIEYKNPLSGSTGRSVAGRTIAQDILVLAVDRSINAPKIPVAGAAPGPAATAAPPPPPTGQAARTRVLLAARPADAERIVAANESGTLHLTMRNPESREQSPVPEAIEYPARLVDTFAADRAEKLRAERRQEIAAARDRQLADRRADLQYKRSLEQQAKIQTTPRIPPMPPPTTVTVSYTHLTLPTKRIV